MADNVYATMQNAVNTQRMINQSQEENDTRNAYARAMRAGGGVEQLQQEQQGLAQRGNMSGADLLGQRIAQMNESDRKHYADVAERTGGTFDVYLDKINSESKKYVMKGVDPNIAMQRATQEANDWYMKEYSNAPDDIKKFYPHPSKVSPLMAMTVLGQSGMIKSRLIDTRREGEGWKETTVMGSSIPTELSKGIEPKKEYKVMRDATGMIRSVIGENKGASGKLTINDVTPEDAKILDNAIVEGRLNPDHVNSRTAPIYAKILKSNKGIDFVNASSTAAAVKKIESQRSAVESFEKTASKNFDMIEKMYDKIPSDRTVYVLNKLKTKWDTDFSGDPQVVPLARAMKTALTEYAKVITGQTGGAAVSDSARKEVESLLSVADRPETFKNSLKAHRQEMKNRMESFQETIDSLKTGRKQNVREEKSTESESDYDEVKEVSGKKYGKKGGKWYAL